MPPIAVLVPASPCRSATVRAVAACAFLFGIATPTAALADPCTGALPGPGSRFTGVVRHVIDGDGLCVGPTGRPDRWIEVRLADFHAPELREAGGVRASARLAALTKGRTISCIAGHRSYDRIVATCTIDGRSSARACGNAADGKAVAAFAADCQFVSMRQPDGRRAGLLSELSEGSGRNQCGGDAAAPVRCYPGRVGSSATALCEPQRSCGRPADGRGGSLLSRPSVSRRDNRYGVATANVSPRLHP